MIENRIGKQRQKQDHHQKNDNDILEFEKQYKHPFDYKAYLTNKELEESGFKVKNRDDSGIKAMFNLEDEQLDEEKIENTEYQIEVVEEFEADSSEMGL